MEVVDAFERAESLGADGVIDEIARSGLGGRGGAGFPAGRKWAAVRANPFAILEGALVARARSARTR